MAGVDDVDTKDSEDWLANLQVNFDISNPDNVNQFSPRELVMVESLLTPGIQTSLSFDSYLHNPVKDYNDFKNANINVKIKRPVLARFGYVDNIEFNATIYRQQNRHLINNNNENLVFQACHFTLLEDARHLISKPWKCTTPSAIVEQVLSECTGARNLDIEASGPARDYSAQNIHPFQVVNQQADVALAAGTDPSFIHYMTYENDGTHHFRSLYNLTKQTPMMVFTFSEAGNNLDYEASYKNPHSILTYSFPCDFDLLSDLLNGVDTNGKFIGTGIFQNPRNTLSSALNFTPGACSIGTTLKIAATNTNTAQDQLACNADTEGHLLLRQARMGLLEQDKIALRLTVPWNPNLHAGKVIKIELWSKELKDTPLYGAGDYLIHTMTHTVKAGGMATTTMDCVSTTVGQGIQ
jgi:hypothetical protein